jgi:hypothetical protein
MSTNDPSNLARITDTGIEPPSSLISQVAQPYTPPPAAPGIEGVAPLSVPAVAADFGLTDTGLEGHSDLDVDPTAAPASTNGSSRLTLPSSQQRVALVKAMAEQLVTFAKLSGVVLHITHRVLAHSDGKDTCDAQAAVDQLTAVNCALVNAANCYYGLPPVAGASV